MVAEKPTTQGLLYDFFVDEASRLGQRTDWFLIFHAILLEAFVGTEKLSVARTLTALLGTVTAYLWFMSGCRQRWLLRHLGECMARDELMDREVSHVFRQIFEVRRKGLSGAIKWAEPAPAFAVVIPGAVAAVWASLLLTSSQPWWLGASIGVLAIALSTITTLWLRRGPIICKQFVDALIPPRDSSEAADRAKLTLISDRATGEQQFSALLADNPNNGVIYFKRGEVYEALSEWSLAQTDFQRAVAMFKTTEEKEGAQVALERVLRRIPQSSP
jgi:hypothetical protein